jgi:hypothetical protein
MFCTTLVALRHLSFILSQTRFDDSRGGDGWGCRQSAEYFSFRSEKCNLLFYNRIIKSSVTFTHTYEVHLLFITSGKGKNSFVENWGLEVTEKWQNEFTHVPTYL